MNNQYIQDVFRYITETEFINDQQEIKDYNKGIADIYNIFCSIKKTFRHVFFIGNGGSAAIASHMTADYMKNGGLKTYSLYDSSVSTCISNDYGYEEVFAKPLELYADREDLLVTISSSGNSSNIIRAVQIAKKKKMKILTFTGFDRENSLKKLGDYNVYVPVSHYGMVEIIHNIILQQIVDDMLKQECSIIG